MLTPILLLFSPLLVSAGLFSRSDDCLSATFSGANDCAILYDDDGCEGWSEPIPTGYHELTFLRRNDAEALVVRKGCILVGYDHADANAANRGRSATFDARTMATDLVKRELAGKSELEDEMSSVECTCGSVGSKGGELGSVGAKKRIGSSGPNCDRIDFGENACIVYDDSDCKVEDWEAPLVFKSGDTRSFSLLDSPKNFKFKNTIESVSVKKGCTLEVFDDSDFTDDAHSFVAPKDADLHATLDRDAATKSLDDDIESLKCHCP